MSNGTIALKAFGAAFDALEAGSAARAEERSIEESMRQTKRLGEERLADYTRYGSDFLGSSRAARGASGVAMSGSPLLIDEAAVRQITRGQKRIKQDTRSEIRELYRRKSRARRRDSFTKNFIGGLA